MMNIFDMMYEPIKLKGKIKIGTFFSGIGTPEMALKNITNNYETVFYCEVNPYPIKSYKAIHGSTIENLGDITKIERIPYVDILHHSPPCQDLSKAGKRKGAGEGTRSGLMYETIRILKNTPLEDRPKVIIMEQVTDLLSEVFKHHLHSMLKELDNLGYYTYTTLLNSKDYEIPQNRNRLYMVSTLGEYSYSFPKYKLLKSKLKDFLENDVPDKYYPKKLDGVFGNALNKQLKDRINRSKMKLNPDIAYTLNLNPQRRVGDSNYVVDGIDEEITVEEYLKIPEATKQGYALAYDGDGVYINRPHQKRGVVQNQMIQTLKTSANDVGVVVKKEKHLRIRLLTPLEFWRLMGISDENFYKAKSVNSDTQLYKQAGNALVVNVYEAILRQIIEVE